MKIDISFWLEKLANIATAGGNLVINANQFNPLDLKNIAASGVSAKTKLSIKAAGALTVLDCKNIASVNPGNVTFDFS